MPALQIAVKATSPSPSAEAGHDQGGGGGGMNGRYEMSGHFQFQITGLP
jgi:hypothetical protein